ncbi:MAG: hypothetical protein A2V67_12655 [Deltaproteobacteria bacterium RBG_13_61_14]|nr:MAG: hypothetical protein A2V67_12655 [Deltaproteobacteria bacterium RBG_13_61_14]
MAQAVPRGTGRSLPPRKEGGFVAEFPGRPSSESSFERINSLDSLKTTTYSVRPLFGLKGELFSVGFSDFITTRMGEIFFDEEAALRSARQNIEKEGGAIIGEDRVTVAGYPGWEFEIETAKGYSTLRMTVVDNRIYGLEVMRPKN